MKLYFLALILFLPLMIQTHKYLLDNEEQIFSFKTKNGKCVMLAKDKNNKYIIYRFGSENKIELQYPDTSINSWKKFKYSFYLRGGGIQNEGEDLNYIHFENDSIQYTIYDTYYARGNSHDLGIEVTNLKNQKTVDIKGNYKTRKGTLIDFRDNNLLEIIDDEN